MAADIKIRIDATKFQKYLAEAPEKVGHALQNIIYKASLLVERGAKINAPVDTGRLRASIATDIRPMVADIHTNVSYARYVHDGTRYITGRPFMADAAKAVENQIPAIIDDELKVLQ